MTIDLDKRYASIIRSSVIKKMGKLTKKYGEAKLAALRSTAREWKLDVKAWLSKSSATRKGTDVSGSENGISRSGPHLISGQLRRAAGNYRITKGVMRDGKYLINLTTTFKQVNSYSTGQKKTYNYSDILDESTGHYYSGYKDRYRNILYKRMRDILHGNI